MSKEMLERRASDELFTTTVDYPDFADFARRARILHRCNISVWSELRSAVDLFREARRTRALLLDSTSGRIHPDLLASILIGLLPHGRRPVVVLMGAMWQRDLGLAGQVQKMIVRLADRAISRYAVQSTDEIPHFSAAWGIRESKLRFVPYFYTFTNQDLAAPAPAQEDFIFSGGNAHRDYPTYLGAIEALPEHRFVIASHMLDGKPLPRNVRAGHVPRKEFIRLMRASAAVVVPMRRGLIRAAGQQTYLNAMRLGKPTIVSDTLGVRDYVQDNDIAWVVDGSAEGYVRAIRQVLDPANHERVRQVAGRAQQKVMEKFSFENHAARLLDVLDEAIGERY